jgi:hypothetical protein
LPGAGLSLALLIGLPALSILLAASARRFQSRCAHMAVFMVVLGHFGMLAGSMLDFGFLGPLNLTSWCGWTSGFGLEAVWLKLSSAPFSYAGMLFGSNLGMLLSEALSGADRRQGMTDWVRYPLCNLGMLAGMFFMEVFMPVAEGGPTAATVTMILLMLFGMSVGMLLGWQLADQLHRVFKGAQAPRRGALGQGL